MSMEGGNVQGLPVAVVEIGAEGGSVTLLGRQIGDGEWEFCTGSIDQTSAMLNDEEATPVVETESPWVLGWIAGVKLLDSYPWVYLYPIRVHERFRETVLSEVTRRLASERDKARAKSALSRWTRICGSGVK
jgi:hypothetical protein